MINPLSVASDGYLSGMTKRCLVIAVAGYLTFYSPTVDNIGGAGHTRTEYADKTKLHTLRLRAEDDELLIFAKAIIEII